MWCELVLNGIGGRTIAEAKERLAISEYQLWTAYRAKHGSLNPMQRADYNAGMLASLYANSHRKQGAPAFNVWEFTRWQDGGPVSLDRATKEWD